MWSRLIVYVFERIIQKNQLKSLIETDSKFKNKSDKNDKINLNMNSMNKTG